MATLVDLTRDHTNLDAEQVAHLKDLVSSWGLLADLSFADLILYGRSGVDTASTLVLLGHVRPTTGTTLYRADLVGQVFEQQRRGLIADCFERSEVVHGTVDEGADRGLNIMAVPVVLNGETVAVLARERTNVSERPSSEQERTYLKVFERFARMLEQGQFPYRDEARLRHRTPRVGDGLLLVDDEGRIEFSSPNAVSVLHRLGMQRGIIGARLADTGLGASILRTAFARRTTVIDEMEGGNEVAVVSHCFPLLDGEDPTGAIVLVRDVTELRRRDRQLVSKDTTIREVHHRVKNNLQTISSLLRLQGRRLRSDEARAALDESIRRIGAISVVHETLAQSAEDDVAFVDIVRPLVGVVEESVSSPLRPVSFSVEGDAGVLPAQVTTTMAVVLTELLQNAVDHAFRFEPGEVGPDGRGVATVDIQMERRPDGLKVTVVDNGVGLPEDFRLEESTGLGLTIVKTFVEGELGGSIRLDPVTRGSGTVAEVQVPSARLVGIRDEAQEPLA
ncbi:MAG: histidine kinase N-terminal domain-containing protein [Acidimicrobiia bacterium]|nr:histidine kinase N-terminal domain-containing protein [Acidimicrobiia bacterium]